jgi:hypothetical protein
MRDRLHRDFLHVIRRDEALAAERRQRLCQLHQREGCARARPKPDPGRIARAADEVDDIAHHRGGDRHRSDGPARFQQLPRGCAGGQLLEGMSGGLRREYAHLLLGAHVAQRQAQRETIHLRLGQGIGAVEFHGILRGDDEERLREVVAHPVHADLVLAHRFEQRRLRARRGAVDLVGEQDVREDRAAVELEGLLALVVDRDADDVGGQQVGRELDALELRVHRARQRLGQRRLAGAGEVFEQDVAAGEQGGEQLAQRAVLPAHHLADVAGDALVQVAGVAARRHRWLAGPVTRAAGRTRGRPGPCAGGCCATPS